jgi:hypothetical protein
VSSYSGMVSSDAMEVTFTLGTLSLLQRPAISCTLVVNKACQLIRLAEVLPFAGWFEGRKKQAKARRRRIALDGPALNAIITIGIVVIHGGRSFWHSACKIATCTRDPETDSHWKTKRVLLQSSAQLSLAENQ